jgi:hypothetical protein
MEAKIWLLKSKEHIYITNNAAQTPPVYLSIARYYAIQVKFVMLNAYSINWLTQVKQTKKSIRKTWNYLKVSLYSQPDFSNMCLL